MQPAALPGSSARQSLTLFAAGATIGLAIAGYGLSSARSTTTHRVPPEGVALVNQRPILRSDCIARTEAETGSAFSRTSIAEQRHVPEEMIREELFVQRGLELHFPGTDPDTRAALVAAVEQQAVADAITWRPTDAELQQYASAHRDACATDGVPAFHDLMLAEARATDVDARATMAAAAAAVQAGVPLQQVRQRFGLTEKAQPGVRPEQCHFAARSLLGEALFAHTLGGVVPHQKLPADRIAELLVGFTLGVEVARITVVPGALGVARLLAKTRLGRRPALVVDVGAAALVAEGLCWFVKRSVGVAT